MEKAVLFTNFTNKDFTWTWANVPYEFKSGQSVYMEDWKAKHFAKHLVDRELQERGRQVNDPLREELLEKCFSQEIKVEETKMSDTLLNENADLEFEEELEEVKEEVEEIKEKKKPGRKAKVEEEEEKDLNEEFKK
jgi:hypothetical protein